jgi:hypothetical protein
MTRFDYEVLSMQIDDSFKSEDLYRAYKAGRYNGINLRTTGSSRLRSLDFLESLPHLRYVEVTGGVANDARVFEIQGLQELVLLTRCQVPIPDGSASSLKSVGVDHRPGLGNLSRLPSLERLQVWNFKGADLTELSKSSILSRLKIEGIRQDVSLRGLETCDALSDLELVGMRIESLGPLRHLSRLTRLWLLGDSSFVPHQPLALEDLAKIKCLEELRLTYQGAVTSVAPLLNLPLLRDVRLRGTSVADGDLEPLTALANRAAVIGPAD